MKEIFDNWFEKLTDFQQEEVLEHILNKHIKSLNEGLFTGPVNGRLDGLFTGPVTTNAKPNVCPACKRPF